MESVEIQCETAPCLMSLRVLWNSFEPQFLHLKNGNNNDHVKDYCEIK